MHILKNKIIIVKNDDLWVVIFFGVGIIMPLSTGLIADFFKKDERAKMMGYSSAVNQPGAMIATILSGLLAVINWRLSFGVYAIINVVAFVTGLFFTKITKALKPNTANISAGSMLIGYIILSSGNSIISLMASMLFIGTGLGILLPLIFFTTAKSAASQNSTFALACISSSMFLGQFLSPILVDFFSKILGSSSIRFAFQFSSAICFIGIIIIYFITKKQRIVSTS